MAYARFNLPKNSYYQLVPAAPEKKLLSPNDALSATLKTAYGSDAGMVYSERIGKSWRCIYPQVSASPKETPELPNAFGFSDSSGPVKGIDAAFTPVSEDAKGVVNRILRPTVNREDLTMKVRLLFGDLISKPALHTSHLLAAFPNGTRCELSLSKVTKKSALFQLQLRVKNGHLKVKQGHCDDPTQVPSMIGGPVSVSLDDDDPNTPASPLLEGNF